MTTKAQTSTVRLDFSVKLRNLQGVELTIDGSEGTLGFVCVMALMASYPSDAQATGDQKFARYALAKKIQNGAAEILLTDFDAIKHYVGLTFPPVVLGPAFEALEAAAAEPAKEYLPLLADKVETVITTDPPKRATKTR